MLKSHATLAWIKIRRVRFNLATNIQSSHKKPSHCDVMDDLQQFWRRLKNTRRFCPTGHNLTRHSLVEHDVRFLVPFSHIHGPPCKQHPSKRGRSERSVWPEGHPNEALLTKGNSGKTNRQSENCQLLHFRYLVTAER